MKDKKSKEGRQRAGTDPDPDLIQAVRLLTEEVARLRAEVGEIREQSPTRTEPESSCARALAHESARDHLAVRDRRTSPQTDSLPTELTETEQECLVAEADAFVARLGSSFTSESKIAILRNLLLSGPLTATQIGEKTGLTTGSLYHHLRELTHTGATEPAGRNRHRITPAAQQVILLMYRMAVKEKGNE